MQWFKTSLHFSPTIFLYNTRHFQSVNQFLCSNLPKEVWKSVSWENEICKMSNVLMRAVSGLESRITLKQFSACERVERETEERTQILLLLLHPACPISLPVQVQAGRPLPSRHARRIYNNMCPNLYFSCTHSPENKSTLPDFWLNFPRLHFFWTVYI